MKIRLHIVMIFAFLIFSATTIIVSAGTICDDKTTSISLELRYIRTFDIADNQLAIASENKLYFVDYTTQEIVSEEIFSDASFISVVEFDPEGNRYAILHHASRDDGTDTIDTFLEIRDTATHTILSAISLSQQNSYPHVSWSPDGKYIALVGKMTGANGESVRVWDVESQEVVLTYVGNYILNPYTEITGWSSDGKHFAYADNTQIHLWDTDDWSVFEVHDTNFYEQISSLNWIGTSLLASGNGHAEILERNSGSIIASWSKIRHGVLITKASPDEQWVAQGGRIVNDDFSDAVGGIVIRNLDSQAITYVLDVHDNDVFEVEWTNDSQMVFSASSDSIYQWDVNSGCAIFEIKLERE